MARGHRGSLLLRCRALPSPSPCRFIPALSMTRGHRGSLLLRCRAFSSLSSRRFIPAHPTFHVVAADQARAAFTPDTIWPVNGLPPDFIPRICTDPGFDVVSYFSMLHQRIAFARLPDPCLTAYAPPFPHRSPQRRVAGGISAPGPHRSGHEPLDSSGSCRPATRFGTVAASARRAGVLVLELHIAIPAHVCHHVPVACISFSPSASGGDRLASPAGSPCSRRTP